MMLRKIVKNRAILPFLFALLIGVNACVRLEVFTVPGSKAKQEILDATLQTRLLVMTMYDYPYAGPLAIIFTILDSIIVPALTGVDEGKYYTRGSVDRCVKYINGLTGILIDPYWSAALECDLVEGP